MVVTVDAYESDTVLTSLADQQRKLGVTPEGELALDEETEHSFDLLIECEDDSRIMVERKTWLDAVSSWTEDRLDQQAARVDLLVVEGAPEWGKWSPHVKDSLQEKTKKHLWHLGASMWKETTQSPYETLMLCRYLETKGDDAFEVRANQVRFEAERVRDAIIGQFKNVNPHRSIGDGRVLMDDVDGFVDWDAVADAILYPNGGEEPSDSPWMDLPFIGEKTIRGIEESLRDG